MHHSKLTAACLLALLPTVVAQGSSVLLSSLANLPTASSLPYDGIVFDVTSPNGVTICGFDLPVNAGTFLCEVFVTTNGGSFVGQTQSSNWTLAGSTTVSGLVPVVAPTIPPAFRVTPIFIPGLAITLAPGIPKGLLIRFNRLSPPIPSAGGGLLIGAAMVSVSDSNLSISVGKIMSYPWTFLIANAPFSGKIYYANASTTSCALPRQAYEYQYNQSSAGLGLNSIAEPFLYIPTILRTHVFAANSLRLRSTRIGAPFDLVLTPTTAAVSLAGAGIATLNPKFPGLL